MKKTALILAIFVFNSCSWIGAGTLGAFKGYYFLTSEKKFEIELKKFFELNKEYTIPENLKYLDDWKESGYGFLKGQIFYFKQAPMELYYITNYELDKEYTIKKGYKSIKFSVRATNNCISTQWNTVEDYEKDKKEKERIEKRFHDEIIVKLEKQMNTKAIEDNSWF
jgi:hypothetical protein